MERQTGTEPEQPNIEHLVIEAFKSTGYLIVNKTLIRQFGLIKAVLLSNYIDKYIYFRENNPSKNGWFYSTHEQQVEQLGLNLDTVRKYKRELINEGILISTRKGIPAREWFKIDFNKLAIVIEQVIGNSIEQVIGNSIGHNIKENKIRRTNNIICDSNDKLSPSPEKNKNTPPLKHRTSKFLPLARRLSEIIRSQKRMRHTPQQITVWANEIRKLNEGNAISRQRIEAALEWYADNIGGEYIPVIESGGALRQKFDKLENAIKRDRKNNQPEYEDTFEHDDKIKRLHEHDHR